jgi:GntR family transcriptional regulator
MNNKPELDRTPGTSLHRQIFLVLRDGIVQGTYPPLSALPKEEALVELFGVSRVTVRRALAELEAEGLVHRRHGVGTFVKSGLFAGGTVASLSYIDELRRTARTTEVRVIGVEMLNPPRAISSALQIAETDTALHAIRLRVRGATPLMVTEAWVPEGLGSKISVALLKRRALYEVLMDQGVVFGRVVQQISAESADPRKAGLLECEIGCALIRLNRLMHDRKGNPVLHLTAHLTPQHSQIVMEIPSDAIDTLSAGHIVHNPAPAGHAGNRQGSRKA